VDLVETCPSALLAVLAVELDLGGTLEGVLGVLARPALLTTLQDTDTLAGTSKTGCSDGGTVARAYDDDVVVGLELGHGQSDPWRGLVMMLVANHGAFFFFLLMSKVGRGRRDANACVDGRMNENKNKKK